MKNGDAIKNEIELIKSLTEKLVKGVEDHEKAREKSRYQEHGLLYGRGVLTKTQIQNDIKRIRRELIELSTLMND